MRWAGWESGWVFGTEGVDRLRTTISALESSVSGGFRLFWTWKSRRRTGRPAVPPHVRALIRTMSEANPLWGAPRIHGEILKLEIDVCQTTVAKYMVHRRQPPSNTFRVDRSGRVQAKDDGQLLRIQVIPEIVQYASQLFERDRLRDKRLALEDLSDGRYRSIASQPAPGEQAFEGSLFGDIEDSPWRRAQLVTLPDRPQHPRKIERVLWRRLRSAASSWSVGSIWGKSGPPPFARRSLRSRLRLAGRPWRRSRDPLRFIAWWGKTDDALSS